MDNSTLLVTLAPCKVRQKTIYLTRRNTKGLRVGRSLTTTSSLELLTSYRYFLPSIFYSITTWRWSEVQNYLSSITALINSVLIHYKLSNYYWLTSPGFVGPGRISCPASYLKFLQKLGDIQLSEEEKRQKVFPKKIIHSYKSIWHVFHHALQKYPLQLYCTYQVSIAIGLHLPPWCNFSDPPFCWLCYFYFPTSTCNIAANQLWTHHTWLNRRDNARQCTS